MGINYATLGGRLPLVDPEKLEGKQKKLYELMDTTLIAWASAAGFKGKTEDGKLIGPFNPNVYSVGITPAWVELVQAESKNTSLDKRVHEVVILSVGAVWNSPYELYAHSVIARNAGIPEIAIQALVAGKGSEHLLPNEQVAHEFARQLATEKKIAPDLYRKAETIFEQAGLVDMVYLIGMYLLTCALLNAFEIPAPE
jgi:4-carboxymuconolactone decarboxylase